MNEFNSDVADRRGDLKCISGARIASVRFATRGVFALALPATVALLLLGPADFAAAATDKPAQLTSDQLAQVEQLCQANLHLHPGESHFDGCVAGLSDSLSSASRADAVQSAREVCFKKWTIPGSPDLAECLLDASEAAPGSASGVAFKSYFHASPNDIRRAEQLSCARLGFDPISGAFEGCVANLSSALDAVDRPSY